ncbi:conjugal transfer protein TraG [Arthrobacter sp. YC-RL1]|uniref:type IV secretory system conjugative DNA transfer family protein n=1 Tax=Arthrobacter sp. YC-RL1 TaxID=1652545 RepID=UPI00063D8F83|nr:TraM recognition domain-containing protein [Arthrobacter sp. YC-RL1]ALQ32550.1 conjugal transfer protein TraG [Arthrobacter sp. YC-RL1]KLI90557.1 conjugal transfer protein TraG [Arthrobacter sp. YC-RL1]
MFNADPRSGRKNQPATDETLWIIGGGILTLGIVGVLLWTFGAILDPNVENTSNNPVQILMDQSRGFLPVGGIQIAVFALGLLLLLAVIAMLLVVWRRSRGTSSRVDHLAKEMGHAKDFKALEEPAARADAERLGATKAGIGSPLAKLVNNKASLFASYEWVQIWLMGPRAGKTSCVCVPQILETGGPVLATSNKRDIVDTTRGPRARVGAVWVHDVQGIIGEEPSWWWNPLSFVTDMETAEKLADVFLASATDAGAKQDAYFESDGKRLLAHLFFAAAVGRRPITDVFAWAQDPEDFTARDLLKGHGHIALANSLEQIQKLTPKQRDGVYGTMRPWVNVLSYDKVIPWIRNNGANRPEFDHRKLATGTDTLYLISKEGGGSARAITAALVMAVMTEAEKTAASQPGGRLKTPLTAVLDEAANVVRWRELPDVYSHYGSRGIVVSTFFQSYSQGVEAYGEKGMAKLWGAANIRVAGSGLSDDKFLPFLAQLVGERDVLKRSSSTSGRTGRSVSSSMQRERILDVADLAALPRGRAILTSSGLPAGLVELQHYSTKPYAEDVRDSQKYYET